MAFVNLSGISVSFGDRDVLRDVNLNISSSSRAAVAGANGSGKTTFMKIIAGEIAPDKGSAAVQKGTRISYLPQSGLTHAGLSLFDEAEKAFGFFHDLVRKKEMLGQKLEHCAGASKEETVRLIEEDHKIQELLIGSGFYERKAVKEKVLLGLGFRRSDFEKKSEEFSGGWQMRIALAKVILENPDILLLDEPTNYLDLEARLWLEDFLNSFRGGVVLVSHDRSFLDVTVNEIYELFNGKMTRYKGNYSEYEKRRSSEIENLVTRYKRQQEEISKTEYFIRKFRYNASKASMVQSRIKYLENMEKIEIPESLKKMHFTFPSPPHSGNDVLILEDLCKAYGENKVIDHLNFFASRGEKIVFTGRNGAGKSTLMRIIAGKDKNYTGKVKYGKDVKAEYFSQDFEASLDNDKTVIEEIENSAPTELIPSVRNLLGAFLFRGDDIYKKISVLSGGEKNRIALLKIMLNPANLLVLDEPTNHLDIISKDILLDALKSYTGTVFFVSHDKYFIENLAERVLELGEGKAVNYPGDYNYYLRKKEEAGLESDSFPVPAKENRPDAKCRREEEKKKKRDFRKLEKELEAVMDELDALDKESIELNAGMALPENYMDGEKIKKLKEALKKNEKMKKEKTERWEQLETALENMK